jgi:hypothetical protein
MSTKTTFKRVALVAVAALGLGLLSVAPSQAAASAVTLEPSATTSAITTAETATITVATSAIAGASTDSLTVRAVVTSANAATAGTLGFAATTDSTTTIIRTPVASPASITLDSATVASGQLIRGSVKLNLITPSAAGTYTVYVYTTTGGTSGASSTAGVDKAFTWTVTVTAISKNADTTSTARLVSGYWTTATGADPATDATAVSAAKNASGAVATIKVLQKNATSTANEALVATITGSGFLEPNTTDTSTVNGTAARILSISAPGVDTPSYIKVRSDGTTGTGTVTITGAVSGTVLGSKTITFSDIKPATVDVAVKKAYIAAGTSTAKVFAVTVKDAAGNAITGTNVTVAGTRADTTTAGKALATADIAFTWDATDKVYYADNVTGASATKFGPAEYIITATGTDADATVVKTKASTTFADTVATSVTITAPASAAIGEKVTYTLTAKEKNGYPIADGSYEGGSANGSRGIFWNTTALKTPDYTSTSVKPFNAGETITTVSGVATVAIYMPVAAGTVGATWTLAGTATTPVGAIDKTIAETVITVSTAVTNPGVDAASDAANEATDAANAATDAALAAADAADAATAAAEDASAAVAKLAKSVNKQLAALKKQLTSLIALVNKLR